MADTTIDDGQLEGLRSELRDLRDTLRRERLDASRLRARLAAAEGALAGQGAAWERLQRDAARTTLLERRCALLEERCRAAYRLSVWGSTTGAGTTPPAG